MAGAIEPSHIRDLRAETGEPIDRFEAERREIRVTIPAYGRPSGTSQIFASHERTGELIMAMTNAKRHGTPGAKIRRTAACPCPP